MASLSHSLSVFSDGSVVRKKWHSGYRCLHAQEGGYDENPDGMPLVRPSVNAPPIEFTRPMQELSYALNRNNPYLTREKWRVIYNNETALTNQQGFDKPNDPRADFVNMRDIYKDRPKLMKGIIFGGSLYGGYIYNQELVCVPGVHAIDARKTIPNVDEVVARGWYFTATTGGKNGIFNFPQGGGIPVLIPFFLVEPTPYPLWWFEKWESWELPDPLKIYR